MKKILYIVSRLPTSFAGREYMINQNIRFLIDSGYDVEIAHFDQAIEKNANIKYFEMERPGLCEILFNGLFRWDLSFQERLFYSSKAKKVISNRIKESEYDLLLVDMIRMAYLVENIPAKKILEYDDLLSLRYKRMANKFSDNINLLGTYSEKYPAILSSLIKPFRKIVLNMESGLISRRERLLSRKFDKLSFTSPLEASAFKRGAGVKNVFFNPPSVPKTEVVDKVIDESNYYVFIGNLKANHNLACLREISKVFSADALANVDVKICVYGDYDSRAQEICAGNSKVILKGIVSDISTALRDAACLVAPIPFGSGIKVKVIEAMSYGLTVLTNDIGVEGIGATANKDYIACNSLEEFTSSIIKLKGAGEELKAIGMNGHSYVMEHFSEERVKGVFLKNLESI